MKRDPRKAEEEEKWRETVNNREQIQEHLWTGANPADAPVDVLSYRGVRYSSGAAFVSCLTSSSRTSCGCYERLGTRGCRRAR